MAKPERSGTLSRNADGGICRGPGAAIPLKDRTGKSTVICGLQRRICDD